MRLEILSGNCKLISMEPVVRKLKLHDEIFELIPTRKQPSTSSRKTSSAAVRSTLKLELARDLRDFLALCASTGVEFLIVGGYALAFHAPSDQSEH